MHFEFKVSSNKEQGLIDINSEVEGIVKKSGVKDGLVNVYVPHATAAIIINESYDPDICTDLLNALNKALPDHAGYLHDRVDNNAGAHIKAAVLGPSETIPLKDGKLQLGTWQSIMLACLDGPRQRRVIVKVIEDK